MDYSFVYNASQHINFHITNNNAHSIYKTFKKKKKTLPYT